MLSVLVNFYLLFIDFDAVGNFIKIFGDVGFDLRYISFGMASVQHFYHQEVMIAKYAFTSLICCQTIWAFYKTPKLLLKPPQPRDLEPEKKVSFLLFLQDEITGDVQYQHQMIRLTFPVA